MAEPYCDRCKSSKKKLVYKGIAKGPQAELMKTISNVKDPEVYEYHCKKCGTIILWITNKK